MSNMQMKMNRGHWWSDIDRVVLRKEESRNRSGVAQRVPGGLGSQISMTFGT
jgi:hypothetical protein